MCTMRFLCSLSALHAVFVLSVSRVSAQEPVAGKHGMVASAQKLASLAGVEVMKRGGNAVDAACAVGFALAVTYPVAGNLGGGGFMLIRLASGKSAAIDYRETAPAAAFRTLYLNSDGSTISGASLLGYRAAGVPGTVAGLALAHSRYGRLKWAQVVEPARRLAEQGFPVTDAFARSLREEKGLAKFAESRRVFLRDGRPYAAGELFRQPELAATLARIQRNGQRGFYEGETARLIAEQMAVNGGLITRDDLRSYRAIEREPLIGAYGGYGVVTMPLPSSGGIALLQMLNMLRRRNIAAQERNGVENAHLLVETMRRAFADRSEFPGDPAFVHPPVQGLISQAYADRLVETIDMSRATPSEQVRHGDPQRYESDQTTHFSVVDSAGNAVSNTYTLNTAYGCCVTVKGAGFLLNNEMDDFTSSPGVPNGFGLIQGEANAIAPGKRPLSSMTPTILTRNGKLAMVVGSPGGPTIINTVLQVILNVVDHRMNIAQAVAAPRLHHQWMPDSIRAEEGALTPDTRTALERMGHRFDRSAGRPGVRWGDAEGIAIDAATGVRQGASDPRSRDAAAIGY